MNWFYHRLKEHRINRILAKIFFMTIVLHTRAVFLNILISFFFSCARKGFNTKINKRFERLILHKMMVKAFFINYKSKKKFENVIFIINLTKSKGFLPLLPYCVEIFANNKKNEIRDRFLPKYILFFFFFVRYGFFFYILLVGQVCRFYIHGILNRQTKDLFIKIPNKQTEKGMRSGL